MKRQDFIALATHIWAGVGAVQAQVCPPDRNWDGHPIFGAVASSPVYFDQAHRRQATSLRFGDLDGDGIEDAVCAVSITDSYVAILLGRGDGTFERRFRVDAGDEDALETCDAWPVDLDGDGDLDIATVNARTDDCTVLLNGGDANFTRGERYPLGDEPRSLVGGDLDGDGDADLAFLNVISQDVSVLLNRGDGTFEPEVRVSVGGTTARGNPNRTFPYPGPFLGLGDIDGDGDPDILVPGGFDLEILENDGAAGFSLRDEPPRVDVALGIYDIEARDLDGDGDLDLAAALYGGPAQLGIWLNDGGGVFGEVARYDASVMGDGFLHFSTSVGIGDIDNDGDADAVVGNEPWGAYALLRNNGDGTFAPFEPYLEDEGPWLVEIRDLNGDGWKDVVSVPSELYRLSHLIVHLNDRAGTPRGVVNIERGGLLDAFYGDCDSADLDGDGDLDLVATVVTNNPLRIRAMTNDGFGRFQESWRAQIGKENVSRPQGLRLAHMDDDQWVDLVVSLREHESNSEDPGSIWVAKGLPGATFTDPVRYGFEDSIPRQIEVADVDDDGDLDILAHVEGLFFRDDPQLVDRRMAVLLNDGNGGLTIAQEVVMDTRRASWPFGNPAVADFDGDGDLDVLGVSGSRLDPGLFAVLLNDGTGELALDHTMVTTPHGFNVQAGDFDGDGDPDAALMHWSVEGEIPYLTIYENDGNARFSVSQTFTAQEQRVHGTLHVEDIDQDGDPDLICVAGFGGVVVHLNDGAGDFSNSAWYASNSPAADVALGDFDGDGDTDIISPRATATGNDLAPIVMLENVMCRCAADLDGDGVLSADDFFLFLDRYSAGNLSFCDVDRDGDCDAEDFFGYLDLFAGGC